jgi:hypothetical protein
MLPAGATRAAVTADSFLLRNAGDLVDICSAAPADPMYTAASNFCQGFTVGVFRVLQEEDMARRSNRMICLPNPAPTRNEGVAALVQWARADPTRTNLSAADGVAGFLSQQYPCPRGKGATR